MQNLRILIICRNLVSKKHVKTLLANTMSPQCMYSQSQEVMGLGCLSAMESSSHPLSYLPVIFFYFLSLSYKRKTMNFKVYRSELKSCRHRVNSLMICGPDSLEVNEDNTYKLSNSITICYVDARITSVMVQILSQHLMKLLHFALFSQLEILVQNLPASSLIKQ